MILQTFYWRDIVEILFFSSVFYYLSRWLAKDKTKNLVTYFYGYCVLVLASYLLTLPTVTTFLFLASPVTAMLFMLLHQETLQRNLIALKNIRVSPQPAHHWLNDLFSISITCMNNNKNLYVLIERTDSMKQFLLLRIDLTAQANKELFELVIGSPLFNEHTMLTLRNNGTLYGINAAWASQKDASSTTTPTTWLYETLLYTTQTDAMAFHCNPDSRTFTIIIGEKLYEHVNSQHAYQLLTRELNKDNSCSLAPEIKEGALYGPIHKKNNSNQRTT